MIKDIKLERTATYIKECYIQPSKINYMYGGNGSGKTTLARVIDKCSNYENCEINWYNNKVDTLVYNQNFIDENFYDKDSISGVFTLGKNDGDIIKEIQKLNIKKVEYLETIRKFIGTQTKLKTDIDNKTDIYRNLSWQLVKEYKSVFKESMRGYLNDKDKFFRMILKQDDNKSNLLTREELLKKYESIHSKKVEKINLIELIDLEYIKDLENFRLLCEPITGKIDLSMITLIDKLQNYDWIIKGIQYFTNSNEQCPFCQQSINEELKNTLFNIIDENYEKQINHIKNFKIDYEKKINKLINNLTNIINEYNKFINKDILSKIVIIKNIINLNIVKLEKKISNPSEIIKLETMLNVIVETNNLIMSANSKIEENNLYYNDITRYKEELRNEVWQYIYTQKKDQIDLYKKEYQNYTKANESIERKKLENYELVAEIKNKINEYEKKVTNINYTATEINKILAMFGFDNFMLKVVKQDNAYRIARNNGENAINTLSEGERRFLTFVYFYHLINGNTDNKDIVRDKVIVIDDPISSLDSDILFIVSILSKTLIKKCRDNKDGIKQVFILTHNVYFYKEVTFKGLRENNSNDESFWVIKKSNMMSSISRYKENPIKTSYELLWRQLDEYDTLNTQSVFNAMRRILEYYFNIIGCIDYEKCIDEFEGYDKLICRSLLSFINDGSHTIFEDIHMSIETEQIDRYVKVFELLFEKMGHKNHYNMMRRLD